MASVIVVEELTMRARLESLGNEIKATDEEEKERPQVNQGRHAQPRADPLFWNEETGEGTKTLVLQRAAKVLTHETGHMFGFAHCTHFECNMNGSNNLPEPDGAPMHLCPVCLRKLHHGLGFDPGARYQRLSEFYLAHELKEEARWLENRLNAIREAK
jgi:archaemetzincin